MVLHLWEVPRLDDGQPLVDFTFNLKASNVLFVHASTFMQKGITLDAIAGTYNATKK
jgi:hypothetical protein